MTSYQTNFEILPLHSLEVKTKSAVTPDLFGGDMLRFTDTKGFENSAKEIGVTSVRWPGELIVDPNFSLGQKAEDNRWVTSIDEFGRPDAYVFDLKHENLIKTDDWPSSGLSEVLTFANENDLKLTILIPEDRYLILDPQTKSDEFFVDIETAKADVGKFLERLYSGHFGEVLNSITLQLGQEYYNGLSQNLVNDNSISHDAHVVALGQYYSQIADFIKQYSVDLSKDTSLSTNFNLEISVNMGRLFGRAEQSSGSFEDAQIFVNQFDRSGMEAIDTLLLQRYVQNWNQVDNGLSSNIHGYKLSDLEDIWTNGAARLGIENKIFSLNAGWGKSALTAEEIRNTYTGTVTDQEFLARTNFAFEQYKQDRWSSGQDYGPKQLQTTLQFVSHLSTAGIETGSIYGVSNQYPGRLSGQDRLGNTVIFSAGKLTQMMAETLTDHKAHSQFIENIQTVGRSARVQGNVFESESQIVAYFWVENIPDQGIDLEVNFLNSSYHSDIFQSVTVRKITSEKLDSWQDKFSVINLDAVWGEGFQDAESLQYSIAVESDLVPRTLYFDGQDQSVNLNFSTDYQVIEAIFEKDQTAEEYWSKLYENGDRGASFFGTDDNDRYQGDGLANLVKGAGGNDFLSGGGEKDQIFGNVGDDTLSGDADKDFIDGGWGNDIIYGGDDTDFLSGGIGNDLIHGGSGSDLIVGNDGNDKIFGEAGNDTVISGGGDDLVHGEQGDDFLDGDRGNDALFGGHGNDQIIGGIGEDVLSGGVGDDRLTGGSGADIFVFNPAGGRDKITDFSVEDEDRVDLADWGLNGFSELISVARIQNGESSLTVDFGNGDALEIIVDMQVDDPGELFWF